MKADFKILSDPEIGQVHDAALGILESIGMRMPDDEACSLLSDAGALVGQDFVVELPRDVVYTSFARGTDMRTDMRTGCVSMACPEFALLKVGMTQMGRFWDLPVMKSWPSAAWAPSPAVCWPG